MVYAEFPVVEKPIIEWLKQLGWNYVPSDKLRRDAEEPFDLAVLRDAIQRLNPAVILSKDDIDTVVNHLRQISNDITGNRSFLEWIKGERSIVLRPGEKAQVVRLINAGIEDNVFTVTNQFTYFGYEHVRFDVVLMINGIPLTLIEAKTPTRETLDYHEAIAQILRYHRDVPQFFKHLALACGTDGINFRYDWVTPDKFFQWKDQKSGFGDPLKGSINAFFDRELFLDFINNFIVFEREREQIRKKIAMYQQVGAANKIVSRILQGKIRSGLVWHTQGSGKSLTMLFAAWKLKKSPQLLNPTILLIVDRIDLEQQLSGIFANVEFPYTAKAKNSKDLIDKLSKDSREVIITTIQKFRGELKQALSERENIIIFVDEAHRTQYGKFAMRMRQAFPNAFVFGFTGTPIEKGAAGRSTVRTFCPPGEKYLDKYGIRQSIEDGATVRLLYQSRLVDYHIPREKLDQEFLSITLGLSEKKQEEVLDRSATVRTALKAQDRIETIAQDVAEHYTTHIAPNGFKAQLVAVDREACALYKEALDQHLRVEESVVIYTANQNDDELLRRYHLDKDEQLKITAGSFQKEGEDPKILIVTDMLLTGFDAPIEQVMYLDKPMRDHKLLQAIARTNRPYPGKAAGIIVDYVGIFDNLKKALNFQEEEIEGVAYDYNVLKGEFSKIIASVIKPFSGMARDGSRDSLLTAYSILDNEKRYKEFKRGIQQLKRRYEIIAPDPFLLDYEDDYTWLIEVNEAYNKFRHREDPDLSTYQEKTKKLIREKLLVKTLEKEIPLFEIDSEYLKKLDAHHFTKRQKVMEMAEAARHHIRINIKTNPVYETLSHRLERILKIDDIPRMLEELEVLVGDIIETEKRAKDLGLSREEYALLNVAKKYVPHESDAVLIEFTRQVVTTTKPRLFPGWWRKVTVATEIEKALFDACFEEFRRRLSTKDLASFSEELMDFVVKYNQ
jgi:type I restriction enzyme R subunit